MKKFVIENNKIYSNSGLCEKTNIFEIVDKIPSNFIIWNIGENMGSNEYVPFCEWLYPDNKENFDINPYTLKAIKLPENEVKLLRDAAHYVDSKKAAEKALKSKRKGCLSDKKREHAKKTIEIFERIYE